MKMTDEEKSVISVQNDNVLESQFSDKYPVRKGYIIVHFFWPINSAGTPALYFSRLINSRPTMPKRTTDNYHFYAIAELPALLPSKYLHLILTGLTDLTLKINNFSSVSQLFRRVLPKAIFNDAVIDIII